MSLTAAQLKLYDALKAEGIDAKLEWRLGRTNMRVDVAIPIGRVPIEVDGFAHYQSQSQIFRDKAKELWLISHGWRPPLHVTNDAIFQNVEEVVGLIQRILSRAAGYSFVTREREAPP